jgi:adenylate cyclase
LAKVKASKRIKSPIAAKLVLIITALLLVSLGAITVLVSVLVSEDVRITAEENNFNVNKRSASEAETTLSTVRSGAMVLLDTLHASNSFSTPEEALEISGFFFNRNPDIASVVVWGAEEIINHNYFLANEFDLTLPASFLSQNQDYIQRCLNGETIILNAAPMFRAPILVLLCPREIEDTPQAAAIFFTSDSLNDNFGQGVNASYLINDQGDVLVHPDYELVRAGVNFASYPLVEILRASPETNLQTLYTDRDSNRYFGAFQKLTIGGGAVVTSVEYNVVFEGIAATTRRNVFLTGAVLFASIVLIWLFSKTISVPLKSLAEAAEKIESGQFEIELKPKTKDEIGALTESFKKMSGALAIFGRFTNREIAVRAMRGDIRPGGETKNATVFFSDIRNFTAISEKFAEAFGQEASDKIVYWLNEYFTQMVACVEKTGGVVDKFIGDAVMAHWGTAYTAGSPEQDALNCVLAAIMMRTALMKLNAAREANDPANPIIKIGCGINSGHVTVGQIGSTERMEYTVIGDAVNLASRTEALNKPMGTDILITENTWNLIGDSVITEEMPPVTVKGKEKPVRMFAVVNIRSKPGVEQPRPHTLAEVRQMLNITPPDINKVDTNAEEKKYKIGADS